MRYLFFLLVIQPVFSFAQKCKYDVDTYDKFLNISKKEKQLKINKANSLGDGYLAVTFCKYDTATFFRVTYIRKDAIVVGKNDAVIFLCEDGTTVKAFPDQMYTGNLRSSTFQDVLNATYNFETPDAIELLKKKEVKSVRIYYNDVYSDYDIKDKFSKDLQQHRKLFLMPDEKILYMLFSLEAKLRIQQDLLIEIADILTNKSPGQIRSEIAAKTIKELKKVQDEVNALHQSKL